VNFRRHPAEVHRLVPWLNRELQVLLNNRPHIAYVMSVITETVTQYDIHSAEFRNVVRPFFGIHTDHFVHELSNYARTNFDLVGYDQAVNYIPNRGTQYFDSLIFSLQDESMIWSFHFCTV
jgi:E3 ubiquitin-protein ligase Topors